MKTRGTSHWSRHWETPLEQKTWEEEQDFGTGKLWGYKIPGVLFSSLEALAWAVCVYAPWISVSMEWDISDSAMANLGSKWWGKLVWLCESVTWRRAPITPWSFLFWRGFNPSARSLWLWECDYQRMSWMARLGSFLNTSVSQRDRHEGDYSKWNCNQLSNSSCSG